MSAPRKLQFWCRCRTAGYSGVSVEDMGASFRDGLAFCAIIHSFHPELIDFNSLKKENVYENNKLAFDVAEQELGIPALLEPEDFAVMECPDRLSVLTYVSQYYHHFTGQAGNGVVKGPKGSSVASKTSNNLVEDAAARQISAGGACASCGEHVHLVQRYLVNGRLYHRNCFRCQKCSGTLLPGMYKEGTLPRTFMCTHHRESRVADLQPTSQQLDDVIMTDSGDGDGDADKSDSKEVEEKRTEEINADADDIDNEKKADERTCGQDDIERLKVVKGMEKETKENDLIVHELKPDTDNVELKVESCSFKKEIEAQPAISVTACKNDEQPLHANGEIHDPSHHRPESEEHQHQKKVETVPCASGCLSPAKVKPLPAPRRKSRPSGECGAAKGSSIPVPRPRQQAVPPLETEHPAVAVAPKAPPWLALVPSESRKRPAPLPPGNKPNNITQDISLTIEEPEKPLKASTTDTVLQNTNMKCPAQLGNPFEGDNGNEDGAEESRDEITEETEGGSKKVPTEEFYNPFGNDDEGAENKEELRLAGKETEEKQPGAENMASIIGLEKGVSDHVSDHPWYRMTPSPSESPHVQKRPAPLAPISKHRGRIPPKTAAQCLPSSTEPTTTSSETATHTVQSAGHLNNGTIDCILNEVPPAQDGFCSEARPASAPGTTQRQSTPLPGEGLSPPRPASTPILTSLHLEPTSVLSASTPTLSSEPQPGTSTNLLSSLRPASTPTVSLTPQQETPSTLSSSLHHASTPAFPSPTFHPDPCPNSSQPPPKPAASPARSPNVQPKSICKENPFDRKPPAASKAKPAKGAKPKRPPAPGHGYPIIKRKVHAGQSVPQEEIEQELQLMQRRLELLENRGVEMEAVLRSAESDDEEPLMAEWFRLINDKRQLMRQESELVYMLKQQSLEEHQTDIEFELRRLFNKPEADRTEKDREREQQLLQDLVSTIEGRNAIVESMHEDKQREAEEDEAVEKISQKADLLKEGSPGTVRRKAKFKPLKMLKKVGGKKEKEKEKKMKESVLQ